MGLFNRRPKPFSGREFRSVNDFSPASMKETMKAFGLEPTESARGFFGWTEKDDADGQYLLVERERAHLKERVAEGCCLREEMELEIKIDGMLNALKRKGIPDH